MTIGFGERFDFRAARIAQCVGPVAPVTVAAFLRQVAPPAALRSARGLRARGRRVRRSRGIPARAACAARVRCLQNCSYSVRKTFSFSTTAFGQSISGRSSSRDQCVGGLRGVERIARGVRAEHRSGIDMRDVQPQTRRRRIRAEAIRLRAEHRVSRADGERMRAAFRAFDGDLRERRVVADAAVAGYDASPYSCAATPHSGGVFLSRRPRAACATRRRRCSSDGGATASVTRCSLITSV